MFSNPILFRFSLVFFANAKFDGTLLYIKIMCLKMSGFLLNQGSINALKKEEKKISECLNYCHQHLKFAKKSNNSPYIISPPLPCLHFSLWGSASTTGHGVFALSVWLIEIIRVFVSEKNSWEKKTVFMYVCCLFHLIMNFF